MFISIASKLDYPAEALVLANIRLTLVLLHSQTKASYLVMEIFSVNCALLIFIDHELANFHLRRIPIYQKLDLALGSFRQPMSFSLQRKRNLLAP